MKIWVMMAKASQADRPILTFNVLAQGPDQETAIAVAIAELNQRGWTDIDIFRIGILADDTGGSGAKTYLAGAIANAREFGFAFIRYGARDN